MMTMRACLRLKETCILLLFIALAFNLGIVSSSKEFPGSNRQDAVTDNLNVASQPDNAYGTIVAGSHSETSLAGSGILNDLISAGAYFDRIIVVPLENTFVKDAMKNSFLRQLSQGSCARFYGNYSAATHPSQPNYLAMVSTDYFGVQGDGNVVVDHTHIIDTLEAKGVSWGVFAEQYPGSLPPDQLAGKNVQDVGCDGQDMNCYSSGGCFFGAFPFRDLSLRENRLYARKHVPFLSFKSFATSASRCAQVKDGSAFWSQAEDGTLPQYVFFTPNQCHDGHGTIKPTCWLFSPRKQTRAQSRFLQGFLKQLKQTAAYKNSRTLVLITYDESKYDNRPNQVYTVAYSCDTSLLSPASQVTCSSATSAICPVGISSLKADLSAYSHYSISNLVRDNWGLTDMGNPAAPLKLKG